MLLSRIVLPLALVTLGWLLPTPIQGGDLDPFQLDDSKAFAASIKPDDIPVSPKKPQQSGSYPTEGGVTLTRADDGLFYARVMVNGKPVRFVVDTGSSLVVLTQSDAQRLGLATLAGKNQMMHTAGGSVRITNTSLEHVLIGDQSIRHVDAVIVRGGLPTSLLGQNLLARLGSITIQGDQLSLN